jgi:hypothetical protein
MAERQQRNRRDAPMKAWLLAGLALTSINQESQAQPANDTVTRIRACLPYEGTARERCFDTLWRELTREVSLTTRAPVRPGEDWIISATMSPVDYSPQITATKLNRRTSGNAPAMLTLGCRSQRTAISLGTTGAWKPLIGDDVRVAYRINSLQEVQERWVTSSGGRGATLRGDAAQLLGLMSDPGQFGVRVQDGSGSTPPAIFDLAGVDVVRKKIDTACKSLPAKSGDTIEWR